MNQFILVVEDNPANQMLVQAVLEIDGYRVVVTASANEAVEQIRRETPDLILMDVQLPGQDGLSFTRQLKADAATANIPVVALTAHAMSGDRDLALEAGCSGYIAKPIDTRMFADQVRGFLTDSTAGDRLVAR
ncbi:MAG TPA: response regulator [Candidatus Dormibacteraeota bacterium]|nr:response regulator [Candidatus Dormibacteraeota bacterium]